MIYGPNASQYALTQIAHPRDVVFFRSRPNNPLSILIELITGGPTQCGVVSALVNQVGLRLPSRVLLFESTIRNGVNGCQFTWLDERLPEYVVVKHGCASSPRLCPLTKRNSGSSSLRSYTPLTTVWPVPYILQSKV
jgi:hypothetical protein